MGESPYSVNCTKCGESYIRSVGPEDDVCRASEREAEKAEEVDPRRVAELHAKLRIGIAQSSKWPALIEGIPFNNIVHHEPVRIRLWTLDECREVWRWIQDQARYTPKCLLLEVERLRSEPPKPTCKRVAGDKGGRENTPCKLGLSHFGACSDREQL